MCLYGNHPTKWGQGYPVRRAIPVQVTGAPLVLREGRSTATPAATGVSGGRFAAAYISAARFGPMVRIEIMCTVRLLMR
jgi:hypothetical protein